MMLTAVVPNEQTIWRVAPKSAAISAINGPLLLETDEVGHMPQGCYDSGWVRQLVSRPRH